jgi:hypothetical protein
MAAGSDLSTPGMIHDPSQLPADPLDQPISVPGTPIDWSNEASANTDDQSILQIRPTDLLDLPRSTELDGSELPGTATLPDLKFRAKTSDVSTDLDPRSRSIHPDPICGNTMEWIPSTSSNATLDGMTLEELMVEREIAGQRAARCTRNFEMGLKILNARRVSHTEALRRFETLEKVHGQWCSLLKDNIDIVDAERTITGKATFAEMADALYTGCNSRSQIDMMNEWDRNWMSTEGIYPIDLMTWYDLRERYYQINGGYTIELDKRLTSFFKSRILEVIPQNDRHFASLSLAFENDLDLNDMPSSLVLSRLEAIERRKAYAKKETKLIQNNIDVVRAKVAKSPSSTNATGKWCDHHKVNTHSNEECNFGKRQKAMPKTFPMTPTPGSIRHNAPPPSEFKRKGRMQDMSNRGRQSDSRNVRAKVSTATENGSQQIAALRAEIAALSSTISDLAGNAKAQKIRILKTNTEGETLYHYLDNYSQSDFLNKHSIYLDSGANRHVVPVELEVQSVKKVTIPYVISDATNNRTPIKLEGNFSHMTAGKEVKFTDALVCDKVTDVLISCSHWLKGTENRIILTADHAYFQEEGVPGLHEIARVVCGMYCMLPLDFIEKGQQAAIDMIRAAVHQQEGPIPIYKVPGLYSKVRIQVEATDMNEIEDMSKPTKEVSRKHFQMLMAKTKNHTAISQESSGKNETLILHQVHRKFGHFNLRSILTTLRAGEFLKKNKLFTEFAKILEKQSLFPSTMEICSECAIGKIRQSPIYSTSSPATKLLGRIHTDCIPLPCESPERDRHGTIIVDGCSRYTEILFHRSKDQSIKKVEDIINNWESKHLPLKVGAVRHDGGELRDEFKRYCETKNPQIRDEPSPAYSKEFNGLVEKTYSIHKGNAITMLNQANMPKSFVKYALAYSIYVRNRMSHPENDNTSPYKMWHGYPPNLKMLHSFGCKVTMHLAKEQRTGFYGDRGATGIFIGYIGNTLPIIYRIDKRRIIPAAHVIYHEDEFPGLKHDSDNPNNISLTDEMMLEGNKSHDEISGYNLRPRISGEENHIAPVDNLLGTTLNKNEIHDHVNTTDTEINFDKTIDSIIPSNSSVLDAEQNNDKDSDNESSMSMTLSLSNSSIDLSNDIHAFSPNNSKQHDIRLGSPEPDFESDAESAKNIIKISKATADTLSYWSINTVLTAKATVKPKKVFRARIVSQVHTMSSHNQMEPYNNPKAEPPKGSISAIDIPEAPKSRKKMLQHIYCDYFIAAEKVELNAMHKKEVWKTGPRPSMGRKLLRSQWIYSYKIDHTTNTISRFKARLVAMGNTQMKGIDYIETYSPVVKSQTLRIMLVIAARCNLLIEQTDVDTAYLNATLDRVNYMTMPEGYEEYDKHGNRLILHLLKSLYGLHQSGREWYKLISSSLKDNGFEQAKTDPCLFIKKASIGNAYILLYVDDMIIMASSQQDINDIKHNLRKNFSIKEMGAAQNILGMLIECTAEGIYLGQPKYAMEILKSMDMILCSPKHTPMVVGWEHDINSLPLSPDRAKKYHSVVMKLAYLANQTRPDIAFTVNTLSQYQTDCREHDWKAVVHAVRYLRGTTDHGLFYTLESNPFATLHTNDTNFLDDTTFIPEAYADASYAQEHGRKSRSGHVFMMAGAAITWFCKKQPVVALSSTEAEYYALSEAVKEALWLRQMLNEIEFRMNDPTVVHQDNLSTIAIAMNPIQHQRVKHMDVKVHFLRDHLDKKDVTLLYCPTEDMVADILTKALPNVSHRKFTNLLGLHSLSTLRGEQNHPYTNSWRF